MAITIQYPQAEFIKADEKPKDYKVKWIEKDSRKKNEIGLLDFLINILIK